MRHSGKNIPVYETKTKFKKKKQQQQQQIISKTNLN